MSCDLLYHDSMCSPGHCIWGPRIFSYRVNFGQLSLSVDIRLGGGSWNPSDSHTSIPLTHKWSSAPSAQGSRFLPAPAPPFWVSGQVSEVVLVVMNPPAKAGGTGSIPALGRSPGGGKGNPLQCSCLENPMDRGAWRATVWGHKESDTTEAT